MRTSSFGLGLSAFVLCFAPSPGPAQATQPPPASCSDPSTATFECCQYPQFVGDPAKQAWIKDMSLGSTMADVCKNAGDAKNRYETSSAVPEKFFQVGD